MTHATYDMVFDPNLLGTGWEAASFDAHRAFALGTFGPASRMTDRQVAMFAQMSGGRAPLSRPPRTLVIVKSRRVAGTRIAVAISQALALRDWPHVPGERPTVRYYAVDRAQAAIAFGYAKGGFAASPLLSHEVANITQHRIELNNGNVLEIGTSDDGSSRGFTGIGTVLDEATYIPNLDALLAALRPSLATMPGSITIIVTTPAGASGSVYELDRRFYGVEDPNTLVIHAHVGMFNPTITEEFLAHERALDAYRYPAEWECVWISGLASFVDAPLVDSLTRNEPREIPPVAVTATGARPVYFCGIDISGGRKDGTAAAVAHVEGGRIIVDACRHWPAPHDPAAVRDSMAAFLATYGLSGGLADYYAAELSRSLYAEGGINLTRPDHNASEAYLKLLPLMASARVELPPDPVLRAELLGLERITGGTGRDVVKHRPNAHDDLINAVAHAVIAASSSMGSAGDGVLYVTRSTIFDRYTNESGWNGRTPTRYFQP